MVVRPLEPEDLGEVVERVAAKLSNDAARNSLINPTFSSREFRRALAQVRDHTWVALRGSEIVGHLYAAVVESAEHGWGAWIGPDGVSFDDQSVLAELYDEASAAWRVRDVREHFVWVLDDEVEFAPWWHLGFSPAHVRGVLALATRPTAIVPDGYHLRRGSVADLDVALMLDRVLDDAEHQGAHPSSDDVPTTRREEWRELLADEEVHHYLVEVAGEAVAQCVTYPLAPQRGSFDGTLHVSAVVVLAAHEHRGVARSLISAALDDAERSGFHFAEVSWRVTNRRASQFWGRYGFVPTYVRLRRTAPDA
jgi:ribosomal protein S18 acetylase RimI-like enzyme